MANTIQKESKIIYLQIGQNYENLGVQKQFDVSEWTAEFPDAHIYLLFKRPGEEAAAPVNTTLDEDGVLTWTVSNWETGIIGIGFAEIRAIDSSTGLVKKSHVIPCSIEASVTDEDEAPDYPSWVDRMLQFGENVDSIYATLPHELEEGIASIQQEAQTQTEAIEQKGITTRASIPSDYTTLSDEVTDLKSATDFQTAAVYAIKNTGWYYDLGNARDLLVASENWGHIAIPHVKAGASFYIKLYNDGSMRAKAWRWRASDGTWGASAPAINGIVESNLIAPSDDCTLYVNSRTDGGFFPIISPLAATENRIIDIQSVVDGGAFSGRTWELGSINATTGEDASNATRIRCPKFYAAKGTTITVDSADYEYYLYKYDLRTGAYTKIMTDYASSGTVFSVDEDCHIRIVLHVTGSSANIGIGEIPGIVSHLAITEYGLIQRIKDNTDRINNPLYYQKLNPDLGLVAGKTINAETGADATNVNRGASQNYIDGKNLIKVSINTGYTFIVQHYADGSTDASAWLSSYENSNPTGTYRFVIRKGGGTTRITEQDLIDCGLTVEAVAISDNLESFLSEKVDKKQPGNIGKFLYVGNDGNVTGVNTPYDPTAPVHVRVGTYNIGHYHEGQQHPAGTPEAAANFRNAIADMGVSLLGINENDDYFDADSTQTPREMVFANWKYYNVGPLQTYSCNGFASDYELLNVGKIEFPQTTRYAWYADVIIGGKSVHIVSAHLDFNDITKRREQIVALITHCNEYERCVIMGDFNPFNYTANAYNDDGQDEAVWEADYKIWTDAGYKLANDGYLGKLATIVTTAVHGWQGMPCDNIIVTSNIEVRQIGMISMDYMHDHRPIWADLVIY